jgi:hypothetical protein
MSLAERFGATVSVTLPGKGLFLVVAHSEADLPRLMRLVQGQVVSQLSPLRALALLSLTAYLQLRNTRDLAFIGPVHVDQERFARVMGAHQSAPLVR